MGRVRRFVEESVVGMFVLFALVILAWALVMASFSASAAADLFADLLRALGGTVGWVAGL